MASSLRSVLPDGSNRLLWWRQLSVLPLPLQLALGLLLLLLLLERHTDGKQPINSAA